ncbi:MAG TPA: methionyl-tRNA formyltransferase [Steroidobacteraceae bacterium]|jgi:methionyl-tRNA formyltransferase|nr:methionyl-tRNA formyltransferase [Steroidobacteraceae bacterium]
MLRVAFAGTPQFALPTLRALAGSGHTLVGVLTQPDRPAGRGRRLQPSPVKQLALELGVQIDQPERLDTPAQREALTHWRADLLVVIAYGVLLPPEALALPRLGCVNLHASLLPRWRGAAPIQRAILAGDTDSGVTLMQMDAGLDTGAMLASVRVPIAARTTAAELSQSLAEAAARLLSDELAALEEGRLAAQAQPVLGATYAPKLDKQLAQIDWGAAAVQIDRQVRAFNPWPVAHTQWEGQTLRIWRAEPADAARLQAALERLPAIATAVPGTVLAVHGSQLLVQCGEGALALDQVQLPGRRVVSAREFAAGSDPVGARLGS